MEPLDQILDDDEALELPTNPMRLNMGPSHPAMHGTIRMVLDLDGEIIENVDVQPGYLHRGFEKSCETRHLGASFSLCRPIELRFADAQQCWLCTCG